jgi:hypothetical protein
MSNRPVTFDQFVELLRAIGVRAPGLSALLYSSRPGAPPIRDCEELEQRIGLRFGHRLWKKYEWFCDEFSKQRGQPS